MQQDTVADMVVVTMMTMDIAKDAAIMARGLTKNPMLCLGTKEEL